MQCEQILQKIREQVQRRRLMIYPYFKDHDRVCHLNSNKFTLFTIFSNLSANMAVYFFFHFHFMHQRNLNVPLPHYYRNRFMNLTKCRKKSSIRVYEEVVSLTFIVIVNIFQWWFRSFFIYIYTSCIYSSSCIAFSGSGLHQSCDSHSVLSSSPLPEPECQPWRAEASAEEIPGPSQWGCQLPSLCTNCG